MSTAAEQGKGGTNVCPQRVMQRLPPDRAQHIECDGHCFLVSLSLSLSLSEAGLRPAEPRSLKE